MKSLLFLGFGLVAGGILGAYATSTLYTSREEKEAAMVLATKCPACPACPTAASLPIRPAPEAPDDLDTPVASLKKGSTATGTGAAAGTSPAKGEELPTAPQKPGLPASAIKLASEALKREIAPCIEAAKTADGHGTFVLDLVVTATSGIGHIRSASLGSVSGSLAGLDACALESARRVQFAWPEDDGESRLRYPVQLP
jgi:hypothetical protein